MSITSRKDIIAGSIIVVIVIASSIAIILLSTNSTPNSNPTNTTSTTNPTTTTGLPPNSFRYAQEGSSGDTIILTLHSLNDCVVEIGFLDESMLYDIIVTLDSEGTEQDFLVLDEVTGDEHAVTIQEKEEGAKIAHLSITIGSQYPLDLMTEGTHATDRYDTILTFDNGANLASTNIVYRIKGTINITVTEDVQYSGNGIDFDVESENIYLDLYVPTDKSGHITLGYENNLNVTANGWYMTLSTEGTAWYVTDEDVETPVVLQGEFFADNITAVLSQ